MKEDSVIDPRFIKGMSTSSTLNSKTSRRSVLKLTAAGTGLVVASRYFTASNGSSLMFDPSPVASVTPRDCRV